MPHVSVHFDPKRVDQRVIDRLKKMLQRATAEALSHSSTILLPLAGSEETIKTQPEEIYVRQQAAHETDINPSAIEIVVEAGRSKGRVADKVASLIEDKLLTYQPDWHPVNLPAGGECCIWVKFCEENGFLSVQ